MVDANEEKKNCPDDSRFKQQTLPSWQPILTPFRVIVIFLVIGVIFLPVGVLLLDISDYLKEMTIVYDGTGINSESITNSCETDGTATSTCTITFKFDEDWNGPVYVYYQLENFYQNHRRYVQSRDHEQLMGMDRSKEELEKCEPLITEAGQIRNPCGLIAGSYFNDVISVSTPGKSMDEIGISWKSDRDVKFKQPDGFDYVVADPGVSTNSGCVGQKSTGYQYTTKDNVGYCYFYPRDNQTFYLHEMFPQINPIDGVTDEHFIVWMRTAALPTFRKLYGTIDSDFKSGDTLEFTVDSNFEVSSYDASKAMVLSTIGEFGGKNPALGTAYVVVGSVSLFLGVVFFIKHLNYPRDTGSKTLLKWA